jgi:SOS-response transcriptional repressor LexA
MEIHPTQQALITLAQSMDLSRMSLREIAKLINVNGPQTIKFHLQKLMKMGYLTENLSINPFLTLKESFNTGVILFDLPILGQANCGTPSFLAEEYARGFLKVSKSIIKDPSNKFAIEAKGDSMNRANIDGKTIEDGDFVIVDSAYNAPQNGDYVLSVIDGKANIKKFLLNREDNAVYLISESTNDYPPFVISMNDYTPYLVNGKIIAVIKNSETKAKSQSLADAMQNALGQ